MTIVSGLKQLNVVVELNDDKIYRAKFDHTEKVVNDMIDRTLRSWQHLVQGKVKDCEVTVTCSIVS
jgi:hypothetical protein